MPKYLVRASYTREGLQGLLQEGGSSRLAAITATVKSVGGSIESFYYAFGDDDVYIIVEAPDQATMAGLSLMVSAAGAAVCHTTALIPVEEIDEAVRKVVQYRPPGSQADQG